MKKPLARNIDHKTSLISVHIRISIPHTVLDLEGGVRRSGVKDVSLPRVFICNEDGDATRRWIPAGSYRNPAIAVTTAT